MRLLRPSLTKSWPVVVDEGKAKRHSRSNLGAPPVREKAVDREAPLTQEARISATTSLLATKEAKSRPKRPDNKTERPNSNITEDVGRIDGRTLRRSGRTLQFATRVTPAFDSRIRRIAQRDGILIVEVLERALEALEKSS